MNILGKNKDSQYMSKFDSSSVKGLVSLFCQHDQIHLDGAAI